MSTHRDVVRAARHEVYEVAQQVGVDMEAERSKPGSNQRTLTDEAAKLINDDTPRVNREQLQVDNPPAGAFNTANTQFDLSASAQGENIVAIWHDSTTNTQWVLVKGNANPPASHEFFYDRNVPNQIIVGNPPAPGDGLVVVYKVRR